MPAEILITGGAGLIGRSLTDLMIQRGYNLTLLDNYSTGDKNHALTYVHTTVKHFNGECRDEELLNDLVKNKDAVIHLAAPSSFFMYEENPTHHTVATIQSFITLLEAMRKHHVKKLVYASTSAVYEGNNVPYTEDMALDPPDLKALSKKMNEDMARQYSRRYGIQAIGFRPFSVYGYDEFSKRGYANAISLFAWAMVCGRAPVIWGDGTQTRDFIHVQDAARAFLMALESDLETQELNLGTGIETTFNEIVALINSHLEQPLTPLYIPVPISIYARRLWADTSKLARNLNYQSHITVQQGIEQIVKHIRTRFAEQADLGDMQMYYQQLPHREKA